MQEGRTHGVDLLIAPWVLSLPDVQASAFGARVHADQRAGTAWALGQVAELHHVLSVLAGASIRATPFKGVTLSALAFGDPARRRSSDIDVYVPRSRVPDAMRAMRDAGYEMPGAVPGRLTDQIRQQKEVKCIAPGRSLVELQWASAPSRESVRLDLATFHTMPVMVDAVEVPTFAIEELLVYLCLHGCRSAWSRLLWIADIAALLLRFDAADALGSAGDNIGIDWARLTDIARCGGVERITHIGLGLAQRVLGAPLPNEVNIQVQRDRLAWAEVDRWLERVGQQKVVEANRTILPYGLRDRRSEWARSVLDTACTPTERDWAFTDPLLRGSRWLPWALRPARLLRERFP